MSEDVNVSSLYNCQVQGTGAEGFKTALFDLDRQLDGRDARVVHILHDAIIVGARKNIADDLAFIVKYCMERAFTEIFPDVPFVVEPVIRDSRG